MVDRYGIWKDRSSIYEKTLGRPLLEVDCVFKVGKYPPPPIGRLYKSFHKVDLLTGEAIQQAKYVAIILVLVVFFLLIVFFSSDHLSFYPQKLDKQAKPGGC